MSKVLSVGRPGTQCKCNGEQLSLPPPHQVFILYFKPSVFRCIALRWVRLLGFATVYGTIILKLYR